MSTFAAPNMLKSQYMSIFGFVVPITSSESYIYQCFQGFPKGAHLWVLFSPILKAYFPKVLTSECLGIFGSPGRLQGEGPKHPQSGKLIPQQRNQIFLSAKFSFRWDKNSNIAIKNTFNPPKSPYRNQILEKKKIGSTAAFWW